MTKQELAARIWESANKMRNKIEASEYKDYILGLVFYRFLSDEEIKWLKDELGCSDKDIKDALSDEQTIKQIKSSLGYYIEYKHLFSTWIKKQGFSIKDVSNALIEFTHNIDPKHKKLFDKIFDSLQVGLGKLGDNAGSQTKAVSKLIKLIRCIPMNDKNADYDVLGFIYEYLIGMFAANAGKKAGEFYTPHEVSLLMSEIIAEHHKDKKSLKIYDPTCGSGSLLINIGKTASKYMDKDSIQYYAQELIGNTYNLMRMNLVMRGIKVANINTRQADTLEDDWPIFDENGNYEFLPLDAVVSNPPYSQEWDPKDKDQDPRYDGYGIAPKSKADYAFLLHDLYHLNNGGIMTIVLPHGVLFRGNDEDSENGSTVTGEGAIRKNLVLNNKIDAIIGLPSNIFFGTGIPTIIMVLKQQRKNTDILFIDASKGFEKVGKNNKLRDRDIKKIIDTFTSRATIDGFSRKVELDEIKSNNFNLNIPRYVDSSEKEEEYDLYASMFGGIPKTELETLNLYWETLPELKAALFDDNGSPYLQVKECDFAQTIKNHKDVKRFKDTYKNVFNDFESYLKKELIEGYKNVNITKEESIIADNIFERLNKLPLLDKYTSYQSLADSWTRIALDLEFMQSEGFDCCKLIDNVIEINEDGEEEKKGREGHVLPFELIQEHILSEDWNNLQQMKKLIEQTENQINSKTENINELLGEESDFSFTAKEIKAFKIKLANDAIDENVDEIKELLTEGEKLVSTLKVTKKNFKECETALYGKTEKAYPKLTDEQILNLLEIKWIKGLSENLEKQCDEVIDSLIEKLESLKKKYSITYESLQNEISQTKISLNALMNELTANEYDKKGLEEFQKILRG
ncbi:type I restriction-modification system subunit M [Treponema bryantii]|uniref:type I restriction-modification system subunit M n=1 Tax=Treponema bryantii TaxID=163 RepID=UPI002B2A87CA|nr:type I restriction-modification system subunit M [Treponema bryantii]